MERTTSGSRIENTGKRPGPPIANFSFVSFLVITKPEFISDPVAGKVKTVPKGIPLVINLFFLPGQTTADQRSVIQEGGRTNVPTAPTLPPQNQPPAGK